ncbi:MAG: hypothetical protein FWH41_10395, partial [Treponema sp.]|nr:hypothetical protein [Treponema sp.]
MKNMLKIVLTVVILCLSGGFAAAVPESPHGADAVPDLYAPSLAGPGGFVTTTGGAAASALNPAQGGSAHRIVFNLAILCLGGGFAAAVPESPHGADAVPDLYAPSLAGPGGFVTTTGGAAASPLNPAQGGSAHRIVFNLGYLAIPVFNMG